MIRIAITEDIDEIMRLFETARNFMRKQGNMNQWINGYPQHDLILSDIHNHNFYVVQDEARIVGCFAFIIGEEPTYLNIREGKWLSSAPYGTIHRLASDGSVRGVSDRCFDFCRSLIPNLRADTHKDNIPMQKALKRNGFEYCGIINIADGSERLAFQLKTKHDLE